jgi:hypothetical protein
VNRRLAAALAPPGRPDPPLGQAGPGPGQVRLPGPLVLDLVAAVLEAGAPPAGAVAAVARALGAAGDPGAEALVRVASGAPEAPAAGESAGGKSALGEPADGELTSILRAEFDLAVRAGLAPAGLVRRAAARERQRLAAAQLKAARRLEVLLVVPAGLCLLPAFVLLGVAPVVLGLVGR